MDRINPTDTIEISFSDYVKKRRTQADSHLEGGIPDYAYGPDYTLRQKIKAIPGVFPLFKAITDQYVPMMRQQVNLECLKVGPSQFPDVYELAIDCARILGIGIPTVYIQPNPSEINAFAYAFEDDAPLIVVTSALLERYTHGELKTVIGHECGHIHNNHGIYNTAAELILGSFASVIPGIQQILRLVSYPLRWSLMAWSRAAEVTCDRAGIICAEDLKDEISGKSKFLYGAALTRADVNIDAVLKQYEMIRSTPVRMLEIESSHPVAVRRIFADKEFMNSEVLYQWRPEWKTPDMHLISKQELDARCEKYISVIKSEKGEKYHE
jgi:hypothetical protein